MLHTGQTNVAYGALTRSGHPFQQCSAVCRSRASALPHAPSTPYNPMTTAPAGSCAAMVWALPRSLAATQGILSFPQGTEMFQFPRFPPPAGGDWSSHQPGCPIRTSLDRKLPALPQGISSRGHVIHRQPAPRHPPCAHHSGMRPPHTVPRSHQGRKPSPVVTHTTTPQDAGWWVDRAASFPALGSAGQSRSFSCAWVGPHASSLLKVPSVEPRGLEPRTSAVQGRRSPH